MDTKEPQHSASATAEAPSNSLGSNASSSSAAADADYGSEVEECRTMLRFARRQGKTLADALWKDVAWIDFNLKTQGLQLISDAPVQLIAAPEGTPSGTIVEMLLRTHAALSKAIEPATVDSLRVADGGIDGRKPFWEKMANAAHGLPWVVLGAIWMSIICLAGFIYTSKLAENAVKAGNPTPAAGQSAAPAGARVGGG